MGNPVANACAAALGVILENRKSQLRKETGLAFDVGVRKLLLLMLFDMIFVAVVMVVVALSGGRS